VTLRRAVWLAALLAVAVAQPAAADTRAVTPTATLDCTHPIGSGPVPPVSIQVLDDQVGLTTAVTNERAMGATRQLDPAVAPYRYFAKSPLFVRTGEGRARIVVPRSERGRLALSWGNTDHDGTASRVFEVGPCAGTGTWIIFPGGYFVTKPHCARLLVRVDGHQRAAEVGVGKACPGQGPPPPVGVDEA